MKAPSSYAILRNADFRRIAFSRFLLTFALQLQTIVMGWQVYEIKKDPLYLGLIGLAEAVPALSLALFAGHVVDRGKPLRIYQAMIGLALLCSLTLWLASGGGAGAPLSADRRVSVIFGVIFVSGIVRAFAWPAEFSVIPRVVSREWLPVASTWNSALYQAAAISGPAVGGILYGWHGPRAAYAVGSAFILAGTWMLLRVQLSPEAEGSRKPTAKESPREVLRSLSAGVRFIFSDQVVLGALSLDMFAVLFGGATALLPIFASEILLSGPESLGLLRSAPAVGALLMGSALIHWPVRRNAGKVLLWAVVGFGLCMLGFALSRSLWLSVLLLGLSGAFDQVSVIVRHTILQLWTPDDMRGRVSSVNMIFIGSSNEIGAFESGLAARLMGTVPSVVFGGCMTLVVVAATAVLAPKLRRLEFEPLSASK